MIRSLRRAGFILPFAVCAAITAAHATSLPTTNVQIGWASWYGQREAGRRTASGIIFNPAIRTAAHRSLPLGSCVRVTHLGNGRFLVVPIIDRGPYRFGRLIDLSQAAARDLGMERAGVARVRITSTICPRDAPSGRRNTPTPLKFAVTQRGEKE